MTILKFLNRFILCVLLLTVVTACTDNNKRESTGEYLDDMVISTKIRATFLGDARLKTFSIDVETYKGIVQLSGFVDSQQEAERAVQLARTIKGVKAVHNSLIVK
jgi:hyperosmotically inducible protein